MESLNTKRIIMCDYCGKPAKLVKGFEIYPHRKDLGNKYFWSCSPCGAYVGCHRDSDAVPMGRLANAQLRAAKRLAHAAFDPLWQEFGMKRMDAYQWLADKMGVSGSECHIGMFDVDQCRKVQRLATDYKNSL